MINHLPSFNRLSLKKLRAFILGFVLLGYPATHVFAQTQPQNAEELKQMIVGEWAGTAAHDPWRLYISDDEFRSYQVLQDAHVDALKDGVDSITIDGATYHLLYHTDLKFLNGKYIELGEVKRTGPDEISIPYRMKVEFMDDGSMRLTGVGRDNTEGGASSYKKDGLPVTSTSKEEQFLKQGKKYYSENNQYYMEFQTDGNLIVRKATGDSFVWGLNLIIHGATGNVRTIGLQADGNFVAHGVKPDGSVSFQWSAIDYTPKNPTQLVLSNEGVLQLLDSKTNDALWKSSDTK